MIVPMFSPSASEMNWMSSTSAMVLLAPEFLGGEAGEDIGFELSLRANEGIHVGYSFLAQHADVACVTVDNVAVGTLLGQSAALFEIALDYFYLVGVAARAARRTAMRLPPIMSTLRMRLCTLPHISSSSSTWSRVVVKYRMSFSHIRSSPRGMMVS